MAPLAYFGIESSGLNLAVDLLILFVVVLYFSLIYWTFDDARRRIADPMLVGCATVASLFPFVGHDHLHDPAPARVPRGRARARPGDAGGGGAAARLDHGLCPHCDYRIERDFVRCPSCLRKLKERCAELLAPARPGVDDLPLLRDRGARRAPRRRARRRRGAADERASSRRRERAIAAQRPRPSRALTEPGIAVRRSAATGEPSERSAAPPSRTPAAAQRAPAAGRPTPAAASSPADNLDPTRSTDGPHADPRQARRLRPRADGRDHRPLRAQGTAASSPCAADRRARARRTPLRRARRAAVLRRARRLHHLRPAGRDGARGPRRGQRRAPGDRRHQPAGGGARLDPRRLRPRDGREHGPRLRLPGVGGARGGAVLRGAWPSR